jgi:AraC-like DNA-binding protein
MSIRLMRSAALAGYLDLARDVGVDPHRMIVQEGLPVAYLYNRDLAMPADAVNRLVEAAAVRPGAENFGLLLAETRDLSSLGALGSVASAQATPRAAFQTLIKYFWLHNEAVSARIEDVGPLTILRLTLQFDRPAGRQASEMAAGIAVRFLRGLMGAHWRPQIVAFEHAAPSDLATHRRVLGVSPTFGQDFTGIGVLASEFDSPIASSDPVVARQLQHYIEHVAAQRRATPARAERELLVALLPTGSASVERLAACMGISRRTLHRRLARHGLTFTELLQSVRLELLESHLAAGRSLTEIAGLLGYSCLGAFSRWRRRQAGAAPGPIGRPPGPRPDPAQQRQRVDPG